MTRFNNRKLPQIFGAALIGTAFLLPASAASAIDDTSVRSTETVAACEVSDATLEWGVIERWRSYISGSIAKGKWEVEGNVEYETPNFTWTEGEGSIAQNGEAAKVEFEGTIHFSGHDDLLQVDLENPTLEIVDSEEAYLLLDLSSTTQTGEPEVSVKQERAVLLDIADAVTVEGDTFTLTEAEGQLTAEGAAAFGGFYSAGEDIDPVTVTATATEGCTFGAVAPKEDAEATESSADDAEDTADEAPAPEESEVPWVPIVIGAIALLVLGIAGGLLFAGRKKTDLNEPLDAEPDQLD